MLSPTHLLPWQAALILFFGLSLAAAMDVVAKQMIALYPPIIITWFRFFFNAAVLLPFILFNLKSHPVRPLKWLFLRGAFLGTASLSFFASIEHNPIPDALALFFVMPLFVSTAAPLLVKEKFNLTSVIACIIGLVGMLILLRPGSGHYHWSILFAPTAGVFFGLYLMVTRHSTSKTTVLATACWTAIFAALVLTPFAAPALPTFQWQHLPGMAAIGVLSALGHYFITLAHKYADAGFLAPFAYTEFVAAIALNFLIFSYLPDLPAAVGIAIIVANGLYALRHPSRHP